MKRKILGTVCCLALCTILCQPNAFAAQAGAFAEHYDAGQNYLMQSQYSSSIVEFRKALRINYLHIMQIRKRILKKLRMILEAQFFI